MGVISSIHQQYFSRYAFDQVNSFFAISSGTLCDRRSNRHTICIHGKGKPGIEPLLCGSCPDCLRLLLLREGKGWYKRPVATGVQDLFDSYEQFNFDELTAMAKEMLDSQRDSLANVSAALPSACSESERENMISCHDTTAEQRIADAQTRKRVLHRGLIDQLKILYGHRCRICGAGFRAY